MIILKWNYPLLHFVLSGHLRTQWLREPQIPQVVCHSSRLVYGFFFSFGSKPGFFRLVISMFLILFSFRCKCSSIFLVIICSRSKSGFIFCNSRNVRICTPMYTKYTSQSRFAFICEYSNLLALAKTIRPSGSSRHAPWSNLHARTLSGSSIPWRLIR